MLARLDTIPGVGPRTAEVLGAEVGLDLARFRRLLVRRGKQQPAMAVGHTILTLVYALLAHGEVYREPGPSYLDEHRRRRLEQRALDQLRALGYEVSLVPRQPTAA